MQETSPKTSLLEAVRIKRWELVPVLMQHGADVNLGDDDNSTPLHMAARHGAPADIISQLISPHNVNMQDKTGETALHCVVREERWELVPVLLQHGADVNLGNDGKQTPHHLKQTALHLSVDHGAPADIITQLISPHNINMRDKKVSTALHKAVVMKRWELVPILLQHGARVNVGNYQRQTALHLAAYDGAPADIITQLISPRNINRQALRPGYTAIHYALMRERWELVPVLKHYGADVNLGDRWSNQNPLHLAAQYGAPSDIITQLISSHNINMQDKRGDTALHKAVGKERWDLVPILLQYGADPSMLDYPQSQKPLPRSLNVLCIATIRSHMPVKSDEAYDGLGLPGKLVHEAKLRPQAEDIVNRGQSE